MEKLIIVTGLSGAGKTQAIRCLEDIGYFCVDNLPPKLVPKFIELLNQVEGNIERAAIVMDIRGGRFFSSVPETLDYLDSQGMDYEVLFLEASDESLVRRYKETRRRHPLTPQGRILEGILEERRRLEELRGRAGKIIDTSELSPHELREQMKGLYAPELQASLIVTVISFGYKYGIPLDADLVIDVRFLPNPYWRENLRPLTGKDGPVRDYVLTSPATASFLEQFTRLLNFLIPYYIQEGKSHLVIAIGCTGGQHRSVVLAEKVAEAIQGPGLRVNVSHRDVRRGIVER